MKKTLLIAVAALAAGVISTQAQVYSQNIVGYANVKTPNGGTYCLTVPFKVGASNGLNEVWPVGTLPDFSQLWVWNGTGFDQYYSDAGSLSGWDDINYNALAGVPVLPVGKGFFLVPSSDFTNTFAGAISVSVGTSNVMSLPNGGTYLVGSAVPYAGSVTNGNSSNGGLNLSANGGLPDFSQLWIWNGTGFDQYYSDASSASGWDDINYNALTTPPTVAVGQGVFLVPSADFSWKVGL